MWFLQSTADAGFKISLPIGRELVVGRKDCEILIPGEKSISRKHAHIFVDSSEKSSAVHLTDCKSKFGSFINSRKLSAGEKVKLNEGAVIKFGQGLSAGKFRLVFEPLVFCCSGMSSSDKLQVKQLAENLGGRVVSSWSSACTHLVMTSLTVTIKVVCALSACKPIVTLAWLQEAVKCFHDNTGLPTPLQFLPDVVDDNVGGDSAISFKPNFERSSLFQDRVFYFLDMKQLSSLRLCVESAGAQCQLIDKPSSVSLEQLVVKESIVIATKEEPKNEEEKKWAELVSEFLITHNLRAISESEIGFALLNVSISSYCNPRNKDIAPEVDISLARPSLSQMPHSMHSLTQHTQPSTHHHHTSTTSQGNVTILAPDTELNTQQSLHAKSSSVHPHSSDITQTESCIKIVDNAKLMTCNTLETPARENNSSSSFTRHMQRRETKPEEVPSSFEIKTEPSKTPRNTSPVVSQSLGEILAVQSIESNQSFRDTAIFAPSSLTPGTQSKSSRSASTFLPGVSLMAELFQNRRKTGTDAFSDVVSEEIGESHDSAVKKIKTEVKQKVDVIDGGLFRMPRSSRSQARQSEMSSHDPVINNVNQLETQCESENEMDPFASSPQNVEESSVPQVGAAKSNRQKELLLEESSSDVRASGREGPIATSTQAGSKSLLSKIAVSPIATDSPFLSSRKRKQSCRANNSTSEDSIAEQTSRESASQDDSMPVNTQSTQNSIRNSVTKGLFTPFATPFTCLVSNRQDVAPASIFAATGGRRSTAPHQTVTDNLWTEDGSEENGTPVEGENPLETQLDNPSSTKFKPVLTEDGFIKPRTKPRLQISRIGRFALLAKSELLATPPGTTATKDTSVANGEQAQIFYSVDVVSLVRRPGVREVEGDVTEGHVVNFKKFRKVKTAGGDCIPTFPTLTKYIPHVGTQLQDWSVFKSVERRGRERVNDVMEDSRSQDGTEDSQDIFNLSRVRTHRN